MKRLKAVRRIAGLPACMLPGLAALLFAAWPASGQAAPEAFTQAERAPDQAEGTLSPPAGSIISVTYFSSVDGAALHYHEYLPAGYNPAVTYPLVLMLPSIGGFIWQYEQDPA